MTKRRTGAWSGSLAIGLTLLLAGCAYVGKQTSSADPTLPTASQDVTTALPSATAADRATPAPTLSLAPSPSPTDIDASRRAHAHFVLDRWEREITGLDDPVIFVHELTRGGGWRGPNAGEQKAAFLSGRVEAITPLPTETPAPGEVVWSDGTRRDVQLISAAEAFADMIRRHQWDGSECDGCRKLNVTGAKLVKVEHETARGPAIVPAWQFRFVDEEMPTHPISHVALRDFIAAGDYADWFEHSGSLGTVYGHPADSRLTVTFPGSICLEEERYFGEVIETEFALTVLIHYRWRGDEPRVCAAVAAGYRMTVELAEPLGDRYVLDPDSGFPVRVLFEEPPSGG